MKKTEGFQVERAARTQIRLASRLLTEWSEKELRYVGGVDCGYDISGRFITAAVVILKVPELEIAEAACSMDRVKIPYIPSFLSFREFSPCRKALQELRNLPDVLFVDGNGIAHPRKMGLASHLGLLLGLSTIGCAKKPFYSSQLVPPEKRGGWTNYLNSSGEVVGICLRTREKVKPVFISPGHKMDIEAAHQFSLQFSKYRIPEPLRQAHILARKLSSVLVSSCF